MQIELAAIRVPTDRMRRLRPKVVSELAESIDARGLLHPVVVQPDGSGGYALIAGWHRLEAIRSLGHADIDATVLEGTDADAAQLSEIDENLIRGELTPAERALHVAARKAIYEKLHPETKQGGDRRSARAKSGRQRDLAAATAAASQALGKQIYAVIYADPPWRFEVRSEAGMDLTASQHYPTMPLVKIKALHVPAADDAALFLWATIPMLPQALEVMAAWGFVYKSAQAWVKDRAGTGYWFRNELELLLVGTRGAIPAPSLGTQPPQVIEAPRGRHSEKPQAFRETIERMFPNVPKLEMFARAARPNWAVWGNEAPADDSEPSTEPATQGEEA